MKRCKPKIISKDNFHKFAEACRILSNSIISDTDMVYEFNQLTVNERRQIVKEICSIDTKNKVDILSVE